MERIKIAKPTLGRKNTGVGVNKMKYRLLKAGEIILATDEYVPALYTHNKRWIPVVEGAVGQELLECNVGYYRRKI